jgi:uncharacterized protein (TIGR02145 family)
MKRLFTLLAFVVTMAAMAQSVAISDDGSVADGSAILEVKSTTKGFLPPRMSKDQRDAMTAVAGLQIWCTDCVPTAAMYFYDGSEWSTGGTGITPEQATAITDNTKKVGITTEQAAIVDNTSGSNTGDQSLSALGGVASNEEISAATSTRITYDEKGLVTAGAAATTADIVESLDKKYVTAAQVEVLGNTSGTNTGDQNLSALGGVASNDAITAGTSTRITYDEKGLVTAGAAATTADIVESTDKKYVTDAQVEVLDNTSGTNTGDQSLSTLGGVASNDAITAATRTKITYDAKGLVTAGAAATTADIAESEDKKYVTDAQVEVLGNTSGTNTGDNATNTQYSGLDGSKANLTGATFTGAIYATNLANSNTGDNATNTQYSAQAALITGLQAQIAELISDNTLVSRSVAIGTQQWMNKNLDVATYRDGTLIPEVRDATQWGNLKTGAWCYNKNDSANGTTYGKLYNWYAVMGITVKEDTTPTEVQIAARKELAPPGWHVPSDAEWTKLTTFLGDNAGGKMKELGTAHWNSPNTGATNSSGFTGIPGGYRFKVGDFSIIGYYGGWWSSTENSTTTAWNRYLYYYSGSVKINDFNKTFGFSVRCLRD